MDRTGARDRFGVHNAAYHRRATELFAPPGMMTWLLAEHEGQLLAAIAVFALGRAAYYMWGASADDGRNVMPNHAVQWAAIRWARSKGCTVYDLWGIPDEVGENPDAFAEPESWGQGGLWGVYRFKQGFGGQVVRFAGAWDLPLSRPGYALYKLALRVRKSQVAG
jgi:peptidoglycan pentaglycine glycine transferase (the first glycine)